MISLFLFIRDILNLTPFIFYQDVIATVLVQLGCPAVTPEFVNVRAISSETNAASVLQNGTTTPLAKNATAILMVSRKIFLQKVDVNLLHLENCANVKMQ